MNRAFDALLQGLAVIAAGLFAAIAVVIAINVALRNLGLPVLYGALDAIQYTIMAATFMAAPWVLAQDAHVKVDLVTAGLPDGGRRLLGRITALIGAVTAAVLGWYGTLALWSSITRGAVIRTSFTLPEWITLVFLPLCMGLCAVVFLRRFWRPVDSQPSQSGL
ncbi:MAG: C4-dicarboxylate ABC transporter permease [Rhodobacteraceae bacterium]|nr:C4-dicarboxylate ABC transporter permease [Paracoccaceae bacterium]